MLFPLINHQKSLVHVDIQCLLHIHQASSSLSLKFTTFLYLSHTWRFRHCWSQQYIGRMLYMNLVYGPTHQESFIAQWLEHLTSVQKVIGSIPVEDPDFFFVLCLWHVDHITSNFFLIHLSLLIILISTVTFSWYTLPPKILHYHFSLFLLELKVVRIRSSMPNHHQISQEMRPFIYFMNFSYLVPTLFYLFIFTLFARQ